MRGPGRLSGAPAYFEHLAAAKYLVDTQDEIGFGQERLIPHDLPDNGDLLAFVQVDPPIPDRAGGKLDPSGSILENELVVFRKRYGSLQCSGASLGMR